MSKQLNGDDVLMQMFAESILSDSGHDISEGVGTALQVFEKHCGILHEEVSKYKSSRWMVDFKHGTALVRSWHCTRKAQLLFSWFACRANWRP